MQYDKEEKSILQALEDDRIKLSAPSKQEIDAIKSTADNTLIKIAASL